MCTRSAKDSMDMIRFLLLYTAKGEAATGQLPFKMREEKARDIAEYLGFLGRVYAIPLKVLRHLISCYFQQT